MLRRFTRAAVAVSLSVLGVSAGVAAAGADAPAGSAAAPAGSAAAPARDAFTITVSDPAGSARNTAYTLRCGPSGGTHPKAGAACGRLAELAGGGTDPFAAVPADRVCTQIYGGAATARITGTWQARAVDASFDRRNGCEIARWRNLEPVLPAVG